MNSEGIIGPEVRWVNPLRIRVRVANGLWCASYRTRNGYSSVSGCITREEAVRELKHFLRMRVRYINGEFVEVE